MTVGQLLYHIGEGCGLGMKGFLTGDWGMPEGVDINQMSMEDILPPADRLPSISSVADARQKLADDQALTRKLLAEVTEERLTTELAPAPWDPTPMPMGPRLSQMIRHLDSHKTQLYYYLKLMGKPVNTKHLWGM